MSSKYFLVISAHIACAVLVLKLSPLILPWFITDTIRCAINVFLSFIFIQATFTFTKKRYLSDIVDPKNKAVLITGCDSGFGHLLAKRLDSKGFHVFASCLFPSGRGATHLKEKTSDRLQILQLDVRKDDSVRKALDFVKNNLKSSELWAVVNNAGISKGFSVELSTLEDFKETIEVNTFGTMRVTKTFLPMIRKSKGRIVNVTSNVARIPIPHITPYCTSKFATGCFSDCLRQEVSVLGVSVISVEPEMFETPLTNKENANKMFESSFAAVDHEIISAYGEKHLKTIQTFKELYLKSTSPDVYLVIDDLESAIISQYPDSKYRPRRNIFHRIFMITYQIMPRDMQYFLYRTAFFIVSFL